MNSNAEIVLSDLTNNATVEATKKAAGIVGCIKNNNNTQIQFKNCTNNKDITSTSGWADAIAVASTDITNEVYTLDNVKNNGNIKKGEEGNKRMLFSELGNKSSD